MVKFSIYLNRRDFVMYSNQKVWLCFLFLHKNYVRALLTSTHNICFSGEIRKKSPVSPLSGAMILYLWTNTLNCGLWSESKLSVTHLVDLRHVSGLVESLTLVLLNPDMPCLCKQCRSREVGFWRNALFAIKYENLYQQSTILIK